MESIKQFVENIIQMCGLSGPAVPIVRHISLVIVVILLAALSFIICRRLLLPLFNKVISRTGAKWNDDAAPARILSVSYSQGNRGAHHCHLYHGDGYKGYACLPGYL